MPSDLELMQLHVDALYCHDERGRIVCTNEPDGDRAPRLFLGRTSEGNLWRFRDDLPDGLADELTRWLVREPIPVDLSQSPDSDQDLRDILQGYAATSQTWRGPAWQFPNDIVPPAGAIAVTPANSDLLRGNFPETAQEIAARQPCWAVTRDGMAVSVCFSARLSAGVVEAGVHTIGAYRGRGYATTAVAAWALAVRATGRVPLYSTSWDNVASRHVARRLGLVLYGADFSIQ